MVEKQLAVEQYYHGLLPREDIRQMLRTNGDFLVRTTEPVAGQPRAFVLSVMVQQEREDQGIKHYVIQRANGKFSIERWSFDSIPDMISHHLNRGESVSKSNDQVILRTAILRQGWELTHDEVEVTKKLGEGAFGEVSLGFMFPLDGVEHTVVATRKEVIVDNGFPIPFTKENPEGVSFTIGSHTAFVRPTYTFGFQLFIDNYDVQTGKQRPKEKTKLYLALASFFGFLFGFAFGLLGLIPLCIGIAICCYRNRDVIIRLDKIADPQEDAAFLHVQSETHV